jgi:flagellar hook protein FlgE
MSFDIALSGIQAINEAAERHQQQHRQCRHLRLQIEPRQLLDPGGGRPADRRDGRFDTQNIGLSGGILNTGRSLDAAINGRGFFITKDSRGPDRIHPRRHLSTPPRTASWSMPRAARCRATVDPKTNIQGTQGDIRSRPAQIPAVASATGELRRQPVGRLEGANRGQPGPGRSDQSAGHQVLQHVQVHRAVRYAGRQHTLTQYFSRTADGSVDGVPGSVTVNYGSTAPTSAPRRT